MSEQVTLLAIGDVLIDRKEPESIFGKVAGFLRSGDIRFAQLEQMYADKGTPNQYHAGPHSPTNISALKYINLDVGSLAGNHTLDWGTEGLLESISRLREAGIKVLGVGKDIEEARQPVIVEKKGTKIAFLGYGCIGPDGYEAEANKPGYAPMRAWTLYKQMDYQPGTPCRVMTFANKEDLAAMIADIKKVRRKADIVIVSLHWGIHFLPVAIPDYAFEVGHAAIDAGADLILGHHAHMLKGIEVYKGKVIFHSLGNFALELAPVRRGEKYQMLLEQLYGFTPDPAYPTVALHPDFKWTMIAKIMISNGKIDRVSYVPCFINTKAEPEIYTRNSPKGQETFNYVDKISRGKSLNVHYEWDGDEVVITG